MKICSKKDCPFKGHPQILEDFHKDKTKKDGLRPSWAEENLIREKYI